MKNNLELRAYSLCLYQLSDKQGCIQSGHAVTEVGVVHGMDKNSPYYDWAVNHKTIIHLNGGTSTMLTDSIQKLSRLGVDYAEFREPDLYNVVTAVGFLVDERIFDFKKYPDYDFAAKLRTESFTLNENEEEYTLEYDEWIKLIGGEQNVELRNWLRTLKLF